MKVRLFIPCLVDQFQPHVGLNVLKICEKIGISCDFVDDHICCGQPFFKAGLRKKTLPFARAVIRAFEPADLVVAPSGSCVHMIRHDYPQLFRDDGRWLDAARRLAQKTYEFSEFLVHVAAVEDLGASFPEKVTFHDSCQVKRGLGVSSEPRRLLRRVRGIELVEMEQADTCCGFGGVFSFKFPYISGAMAASKIERIKASGASVVTGCEISCLLHLEGHLRALGLPVRALHLADILASGI